MELYIFFTITSAVVASVCLLHIAVVRGYNAPDILADKLDFNDNYRFSPGPVRHGDDILTPLAHWCGWDLKCSFNILMYVRLVVQSKATYQPSE